MKTELLAAAGVEKRWRVTIASGPYSGNYVEAQSIAAAVADLRKLFGLVEVSLKVRS